MPPGSEKRNPSRHLSNDEMKDTKQLKNMKKTYFKKTCLFLLSAMTVASAACSKNDSGAPVECDFTASINGAESSGWTWENGSQIGISGKSGKKKYANVTYKVSNIGTGALSVVTTGQEIYYQDGSAVDFTAYYPWNSLLSAPNTITANTYEQRKNIQKTFDFLWAKATGSKADPTVSFAFNHKMAKLNLIVKQGSGVTYDEVQKASLSLENFRNNGTFNAATGATATTGDLSGEWTFANNTTDASFNAPVSISTAESSVNYSLIFFPQEFSSALPVRATLPDLQVISAALDFTEANRKAGDSSPKNELTAGRQYDLIMTLQKSVELKVELKVNSCTIGDWNSADGGNTDAY